MEVLFKDDNKFFYIEENELKMHLMEVFPNIDFTNIKHLDDIKILYHYRDIHDNSTFPVYYEFGNSYITRIDNDYTFFYKTNDVKKIYTLVNLGLVEN